MKSGPCCQIVVPSLRLRCNSIVTVTAMAPLYRIAIQIEVTLRLRLDLGFPYRVIHLNRNRILSEERLFSGSSCLAAVVLQQLSCSSCLAAVALQQLWWNRALVEWPPWIIHSDLFYQTPNFLSQCWRSCCGWRIKCYLLEVCLVWGQSILRHQLNIVANPTSSTIRLNHMACTTFIGIGPQYLMQVSS